MMEGRRGRWRCAVYRLIIDNGSGASTGDGLWATRDHRYSWDRIPGFTDRRLHLAHSRRVVIAFRLVGKDHGFRQGRTPGIGFLQLELLSLLSFSIHDEDQRRR